MKHLQFAYIPIPLYTLRGNQDQRLVKDNEEQKYFFTAVFMLYVWGMLTTQFVADNVRYLGITGLSVTAFAVCCYSLDRYMRARYIRSDVVQVFTTRGLDKLWNLARERLGVQKLEDDSNEGAKSLEERVKEQKEVVHTYSVMTVQLVQQFKKKYRPAWEDLHQLKEKYETVQRQRGIEDVRQFIQTLSIRQKRNTTVDEEPKQSTEDLIVKPPQEISDPGTQSYPENSPRESIEPNQNIEPPDELIAILKNPENELSIPEEEQPDYFIELLKEHILNKSLQVFTSL